MPLKTSIIKKRSSEILTKPKQHYDKIAGARVLLIILKLVAIWPWKDVNEINNNVLKESSVQIIQRFIIHVPMSLMFCFLVWIEAITSQNLDQAGSVLYLSLTLSAYLVKFLNMRLLIQKTCLFINDLQYNTMFDLLTPLEIDTWMKHQKGFHNVVLIFAFACVFSGVSAFVGVLFADEYRLGFPYWVPFEWRNPDKYWYAYSFNVAGILVCCFSNASLDLFGSYLIFHTGLLYKILGMRYSQVQHLKEENAINELRKLYLLHSHIKRMTKQCEVLVSYFVLSQIIFSALIICFCGYRLKNMNIFDEFGEFLSMLPFLSVMILEIYLPCHFANQIKINSANLLYKMYSCQWLEFSMDNRKFLYLYMEFFKQPQQLKAANFFEIGLPIFTKVMNNAYSFFALLLNMDK